MTVLAFSRPPMTKTYLVKLISMIAMILAAGVYLASRYTVGLDTQTFRCLPQWVFVIDTWNKPTAADLSPGDIVAVRLRPDQTPRNANWPTSITFVKRVLANDPATLIQVTSDGIFFNEPDGTRRSHGTALEAAHFFGRTPESYERELHLLPGQMWMMGDFENTYDSRYYGPVDQDQIVGSVLWAF